MDTPHERSGAPKVFGVLSIIFSSLVLLGSVSGLLAGVAALAASMEPMGPMASVYKGIALQSLLLLVMSVLLLVIGIGQLHYRAWAPRWSVYWGVAGLVSVAAMVAISMMIISPAYGEFLDSLPRLKPQPGEAPMPQSMGAMRSVFGGTFAVLTVIFYAPYPALMLLYFSRDRVRAAMTT